MTTATQTLRHIEPADQSLNSIAAHIARIGGTIEVNYSPLTHQWVAIADIDVATAAGTVTTPGFGSSPDAAVCACFEQICAVQHPHRLETCTDQIRTSWRWNGDRFEMLNVA